MFAKLVVLGNSVRQDARILSISHATAWRWRHDRMRRLEEQAKKRSTHPAEVAIQTRSVLFNNRLFWGALSNRHWAERHRLDYLKLRFNAQHNVLESPTVYFTVSTDKRSASVRHFSVTADWTSPLDEGFSAAALNRIHDTTKAYLLEGTWLITLKRSCPKNVLEESRTVSTRWEGRASPLYLASRATQELQHLFCQWMARFRGVAIKYLGRYAALFEKALERGEVEQPRWWDLRTTKAWRPA